MTSPEAREAFGRFHAAEAYTGAARVTVDHGYKPSSAPSSTSMSTLSFPEFPAMRAEYTEKLRIADTAAAMTFGPILGDPKQIKLMFNWVDSIPADNPSGVTIEADEPLTPQIVLDYARRHGLIEIADELHALFELPHDSEEEPLSADAALSFVRYCVVRKKTKCPLISATPSGNLDVVWTAAPSDRVIMRFFTSGTVWIALKLGSVRGSLELPTRDLTEQRLTFKLPDWA